MRYFQDSEFKCKCSYDCGKGAQHMDPHLRHLLDVVRDRLGQPITITSAIRCVQHNTDIGGSTTSSHIKGLAVDIAVPNSNYRFHIKKILKNCGVTRIGDSKDGGFIHIDVDHDKAQFVEWLY